MKLRDYQDYAVESIFTYFENGGAGNPIVVMPTGCHAKGQGILLFSGEVKPVEDVQVGDLLMGPDSRPRLVKRLYRGRQEMRRIVPNNGSPWIVNKDHILALRKSQEKRNTSFSCHKPNYITETVAEFEKSSKWHRHIHKLYRVPVEFASNPELTVNPYFLGLFLGDGSYTQSQVQVCSMDNEILEFCKTYLVSLGDSWRLTNNGSKAFSIHATTKIKNRTRRTIVAQKLDALGLRGKGSATKFIPQQYKIASRQNRLELLAGLLDTDGHNSSGGFEYCTTSDRLAEDVVFLARGLGFACSVRKNSNEYSGYFRIFISGDCSVVPVKLERKKCKAREQKKNVLHTGFKVECLPEDDYYGFELDGDHLYLLDDFTVTHNTGKSLVIGDFMKRARTRFPNTRMMKLTHVKELVRQNLDKLLTLWPTAPVGVYSAGLGRKDIGFPIVFGGVASVAKATKGIFGHMDLLLIDECHLLSPKDTTMYQAVIAMLKEANPLLKVIGFTATPFRLGQGMLTEGEKRIFTDICVNMSTLEAFNWFLDEGYLCRLVPKRPDLEIDVSKLPMRGGEFKEDEMQAAVDKYEITEAAVRETIAYGMEQNRQHWLFFAAGIENTLHVTEMFQHFGVKATCVHSKMLDNERDDNIADYVAGEYQVMVNNGILTTGFDYPGIDLIGILRPTGSASLWVQMLGRGTRPVYAPGYDLEIREGRLAAIAASFKPDCLVLDFAGNTKRLGPINDPLLPQPKGKKGGTAPVRLCEKCNTYNHASALECSCCGEKFAREVKFGKHASTEVLIKENEGIEEPVTQIFKVDRITYIEHRKEGRPPSIQVSYFCGLTMLKEWVALEHDGPGGYKARKWWAERSDAPTPATTTEALKLLNTLREPTHLRVWMKKPYNEIKAFDFTGTGFNGATK